MVEITLPIVLQILQTAGILVGIIYYITIMRNQQKTRELSLRAQEQATKTRQIQIFMQIFQQLNSEETHKSWAELANLEINIEDYLQKYDSSVNPAHYAKRAVLWYSFNTIGELLRMGIIDPVLLHRLSLGPMVIITWERWADIIRELRVMHNAPDIWEGFEYLYNEMKRLRSERDYPDVVYQKPN